MRSTINEEPLPPYLEILNPEQRRAVLHTGRPLLILAGAGSGKTRVITTKIAWLIREQGLDPRSILAVTFTNKAAREMAERARLIDERAANAMLRTFHSFGAWFLRRNGGLAGLDSGFVIYDDDDMISLLSGIMADTPKAEVKKNAHNISRAKDYFLRPDSPELALIDSRKNFRELYAMYEERLALTGNVDFGDLIKKPVEILRAYPEVARRFRERFSVIMVDEYQDANVAQFELLKELTGPDTYVCVVGDDDQSIYRFRGAEVKNILEFPSRFDGTEIIRLERNYRSTAPILRAASSVVNNNRGRLGKTLSAERGNGKQPVLAFLPNQDEEAAYCAALIENSVKGNSVKQNSAKITSPSNSSEPEKAAARWSDWAILYRINAQSMGFENEFLRRGIPYHIVGSIKFYEREEIKDALALLAICVNPRDEVAFRRVVNKPTRGIGTASVERIIEEFESRGCDLTEAALHADISPKARSGITAFLETLDSARQLLEKVALNTSDENADGEKGTADAAQMAANSENAETVEKTAKGGKNAKETKNGKGREGGKKRQAAKGTDGLRSGEGLSICVEQLLRDSGIAEHHQSEDDVAGNQRIYNLQELLNAASLYPLSREGLLEFLEHIELDRSLAEQPEEGRDANDAVTLITFHNTKGLEFRRVIMTGLEQGGFPRNDKKDEELEEERRLFYVGATRAMDELYFCSCAMRRMFGHTESVDPSLFLRELDKSNVRIIGAVPRGFNSSGSRPPVAHNTQTGAASAMSDAEKKAGWRRGDRLFHDDNGYGAVMEVRDSADGPVVKVRFETGKELQFLSKYQGSGFVKMGKDD